MVAHAAEHLGRFDADAEDVVHDVLVAMLDGTICPPRKREPAVEWLLDLVESFARAERTRAAREWGE